MSKNYINRRIRIRTYGGVRRRELIAPSYSIDCMRINANEESEGSQRLIERINNLNIFVRGWTNYFQLTKTERLLKDLDS